MSEDGSTVSYRADGDMPFNDEGRWRSPMHMPRWASRITLEIVGAWLEPLHAISDENACREGVTMEQAEEFGHDRPQPTGVFRDLWEAERGPGSWERNPWVWVVEFKVILQNVDTVLGKDREVA
mgnify:FL=1